MESTKIAVLRTKRLALTTGVENESSPVLVTPPHCIGDIGDVVAVESEMLQSVSIPLESDKRNYGMIGQKSADSQFGAEDEENMQELEDRTGLNQITHILPANGYNREDSSGYDVCNEYGYTYSDEDDDVDEDDNNGLASFALDPTKSLRKAQGENGISGSRSAEDPGYIIYILGKNYDPIDEYAPRRTDECSLFWFTYRMGFPEIIPYKITTDAGWGCMLRSAQMILGQTLRMHYKGRTWKPPLTIAQRRRDPFLRQIMTWFADYPSNTESIFSLHNMVAAGLAKYETLPGEWYGPSKASYVIRDLCRLYEEQQQAAAEQGNNDDKDTREPRMFRVHVATQGTIYQDSVNELMTKSQESKEEETELTKNVFIDPPTHPLDPNFSNLLDETSCHESLTWDTSILILVPLRLGLKNFNEDYSLQLAHIFSLKQSVGVIGGRPRGARWFYGANSDGKKLYCLDPHTIHSCPERRETKLSNGKMKMMVTMTDDYLRSIHTTRPECMNINCLDPSLALGFYCRDRDDFKDLCASLQKWKDFPKMPDIVTVAKNVPDYSANVSSIMTDMMMSMTTSDAPDGDLANLEPDDEDDFVLL